MRKSATMSVGLALVLIALVVIAIVFGPLVSIWALNTLFGLGIQYSLATWAAAAWCSLLLGGSVARKASKS